MQMTVVLTTSL